jgi:hypothetical protein
MPFFPRILEGLVGLQHRVIQRHEVAVAEGPILEPVPQSQQLGAVAAQFAGQLGGGDPLGETAEDQDQLAGSALGAVQGRGGEGVEDATAVAAAEVQDRGAAAAMDGHAIVSMATRAGHAVGVQPGDELVIARLFIHQVDDREVHGGLRTGVSRMRSPKYRRAGAGCKRPTHRFPYMSQ